MAARCFTALIFCAAAPFVASATEPGHDPILVIAHRGAHHDAPENSLAAIRAAIEIGCDYVEVDVRTTSDGHLVLMHDGTVDRTTDGSGRIDQLSLAQILQFRFGAKWPDERVPTFEDALALCNGRIKVYIDHKEASPARVLKLLQAHKMLGDVVIYGDVEVLREYKRLCPEVWIMPPHPGSAAEIRKLAANLEPETLDGNITSWTAEQVKAAHDVDVQVWVDNPPILDNDAGIRAATKMNVDAIQTDHPKRVIELLKSFGLRQVVEPPQRPSALSDE